MISQRPVAFTITIPLLGPAAQAFTFKVPGTFSGFPPVDPTQARFFSRIEIFADNATAGEWVDVISIEDTDGVIPVPARVLFPAYPTIYDFSADVNLATGTNKGGYYFRDGLVTIGTLDHTLQVVPSGLYFKGTLNGGLNKTYRVNVIWGVSS